MMAAKNMIHEVEEKMKVHDLHKVNPNTGEVTGKLGLSRNDLLMQAGIPTVLAAIYQFGMTETGAKRLLNGNSSTNWMQELLGDKSTLAAEKIAEYSKESFDTVRSVLQKISIVAIGVLKENLPKDATDQQVFELLGKQRHSILSYLPEALQTGDLWGDSTIDDETNKMEGPVSSVMHAIENKLSSPSK